VVITMSSTHSETQLRLANALALMALTCRTSARSRKWAGEAHASHRQNLREEARRSDVLRAAILATDPLELDAVVDQR
jgi:hypothetical protein